MIKRRSAGQPSGVKVTMLMYTNRKLIFNQPFDVGLVENTIDAIQPDEIVVQNLYSLISPGTELAFYSGTHTGLGDPSNTWAKYPFCPGYSTVGKILAKGGDVLNFREGDTIYHTGKHEQYQVLNAARSSMYPVPADLDPRAALFARFAQIAYTAIGKVEGNPQRVLVLGAGIIGNLAAQLFRTLKSANVIVADIIDQRLDLARQCGISKTCNSSRRDFQDQLNQQTGGEPINCIIEATGVPDLINFALGHVGINGEVVLLGSPRGSIMLDAYKQIHSRGVRLTGAHETTLSKPSHYGRTVDQPTVIREMLGLIRVGRLVVRPLIGTVLKPEDAKQGYEGLLRQKEAFHSVMIDWR